MSVTKENGENLYIVMPAHLGGRFNTTGVKFHGPNRYIKGSEKESIVLNTLPVVRFFSIIIS